MLSISSKCGVALIPAPGAGKAGTSAPWSLRRAYGSSRSLRPVADDGVQEHRDEEDHADEGKRPVRVPLRIDHAELNHPEDACAEERADDRAVAAGQQAAADDGADD